MADTSGTVHANIISSNVCSARFAFFLIQIKFPRINFRRPAVIIIKSSPFCADARQGNRRTNENRHRRGFT